MPCMVYPLYTSLVSIDSFHTLSKSAVERDPQLDSDRETFRTILQPRLPPLPGEYCYLPSRRDLTMYRVVDGIDQGYKRERG